MFAAKTLIAFMALASFAKAQDVLDTRVLASTAECPATTGPDVNANVLAVVNFVETATATLDVAGADIVTADLAVNLQVCLCVDANVGVGAINLPANLNAAAIADIEAYAAAEADTNPLADIFNQLVGTVGDLTDVDVTLDLRPTSRLTCDDCPANATPTCINGACGCDCPTGFFYSREGNACVLSASGAVGRRTRSKMPRYISERQVGRMSSVYKH